MYDRRQFVERAALIAGTALLPIWGQAVRADTRLGANPFNLGIASGDPQSDGVVLWTRLAIKPLDADGGMPAETINVAWEVAEDEQFKRVVRNGVAPARPQAAHSVHVEVAGLRPNHVYHYRFFVGSEESPVGRTRTAPLASADIRHMRYAFTGCQRYNNNFYPAYRQMVADDPDIVMFLGDYIYEKPMEKGVRGDSNEEAHDLRTYRQRHAIYKSDPLLRAAHAAAPWMTIWDDHEVRGNYRGDLPPDGKAKAKFLIRRAAAYQAYYEHMPLRRRSLPVGPSMQIYRALDWGQLAQFQFVDLRQYRDFTPCFEASVKFNTVDGCKERTDPKRSILGAAQEKWLFDTMGKSTAQWNILAQQYLMAEFRRRDPETGQIVYSTDGWDGYPADRKRVMDFWRDANVKNPYAIGSDSHAFLASELRETPEGLPVASAFVGGSMASRSRRTKADWAQMRSDNPHFRFTNGERRGYALVNLTSDENRIDYKAALNSEDEKSPTEVLTSFVVENGKPGFSDA